MNRIFRLSRRIVTGALGLLLVATISDSSCAAGPTPSGGLVQVDSAIQPYTRVEGIAGNLSSIGSDTLNNLMTYWADSFGKLYPDVHAQIEGKGSNTASPALTEGTAQLGPMSRAMKPEEEEAFEKKHGFKPTKIAVAIDALAIYVNKDNPLESLNLQQADAIFSKSRKSGAPEDITTWGQLGLTGKWAMLPVSLYGRNSASGTYTFFKEHVLAKGDYKDTVKEQPGSSAVVLGITQDVGGIGYSGIGYRTSGVKALSLSKNAMDSATVPTYQNVLKSKYPLARMLYVYVAKQPGQPLPPLVEEFLKFVLSKEGQEIVVKDGFLPLPATAIEKQLQTLETK